MYTGYANKALQPPPVAPPRGDHRSRRRRCLDCRAYAVRGVRCERCQEHRRAVLAGQAVTTPDAAE
jgi:hypothetical protein